MSEPDGALVRYEAARQALAEAHRVDEVKGIRDKAIALQAYARQAKDRDLITWAGEIKVRAERRAGELLKEMGDRGERVPQGGDQKSKSHRSDFDRKPTLQDLGVTRNQSSDWQKLAALPAPEFERRVAERTVRIVTGGNGHAATDSKPERTGDPRKGRAILRKSIGTALATFAGHVEALGSLDFSGADPAEVVPVLTRAIRTLVRLRRALRGRVPA